jgi:intracellular septation protein A
MTNSSIKYWNKPFLYRLRVAISIALLLSVSVIFLFVGLRAIYNNPNFITIGLGLPYFVFGVLILGAYFLVVVKNV